MFPARLSWCALLLISALGAQAQTPPRPGGARFEAHKQQELARIANRIQVLQTLQSCVQAAADHHAVKACNETAHASMKK